jgi:hypothetical protein
VAAADVVVLVTTGTEVELPAIGAATPTKGDIVDVVVDVDDDSEEGALRTKRLITATLAGVDDDIDDDDDDCDDTDDDDDAAPPSACPSPAKLDASLSPIDDAVDGEVDGMTVTTAVLC